MINIKLRMSIEQIIFNLLNKNAHTWVRYWQQKEMSGLTMPGEYIEIRTFFLSGIELSDFLEAGFKINKIQSQKIDADAYWKSHSTLTLLATQNYPFLLKYDCPLWLK